MLSTKSSGLLRWAGLKRTQTAMESLSGSVRESVVGTMVALVTSVVQTGFAPVATSG